MIIHLSNFNKKYNVGTKMDSIVKEKSHTGSFVKQNDVSGLNFGKDRRKNNCDKERNVTTIRPTCDMEKLDTVSRKKSISKKVCDQRQAVIEIKKHATNNVVNEKNESNNDEHGSLGRVRSLISHLFDTSFVTCLFS